MKRWLRFFFVGGVWLMVVACDVVESPPREPQGEASSERTTVQTEKTQESEPEGKESAGALEPDWPEIRIALEANVIRIEGAIQSKVQAEGMVEMIRLDHPDAEVINELKVERHRHGVSWPRRLADELVKLYFEKVEDPVIQYREGVVTLKGRAKNPAEIQMISERAINVFMDPLTQDIENGLLPEVR